MREVTWTKDQLKDGRGYPLTQSLFLEIMYHPEYSLFTLADDDKEYNGKTYPSLRQYYLEIGDITEYQFATKCLLGWDHWQRLVQNKEIKKEVDKWREELEVAIRSEAISSVMSASMDNFQAAKWLADRGWDKRGAGRPSKAEAEREKKINSRISDELNETIIRMERVANG